MVSGVEMRFAKTSAPKHHTTGGGPAAVANGRLTPKHHTTGGCGVWCMM